MPVRRLQRTSNWHMSCHGTARRRGTGTRAERLEAAETGRHDPSTKASHRGAPRRPDAVRCSHPRRCRGNGPVAVKADLEVRARAGFARGGHARRSADPSSPMMRMDQLRERAPTPEIHRRRHGTPTRHLLAGDASLSRSSAPRYPLSPGVQRGGLGGVGLGEVRVAVTATGATASASARRRCGCDLSIRGFRGSIPWRTHYQVPKTGVEGVGLTHLDQAGSRASAAVPGVVLIGRHRELDECGSPP